MKVKKAICQLWGHDYVFTPEAFQTSGEGSMSICRRCGKEHVRAASAVSVNGWETLQSREAMLYWQNQRTSSQDAR